jgi:hypothetical protein
MLFKILLVIGCIVVTVLVVVLWSVLCLALVAMLSKRHCTGCLASAMGKRIKMLTIELGNQTDLEEAQRTVAKYHYLHRPVDPRARPMAYMVKWHDIVEGVVMLGIPHATKCRGWWGYTGLPSQWQVVDLCRIWLSPSVQYGGRLCEPGQVPGFIDRHGMFRPTVATWAIATVLENVQRDRVAMWPPVYPDQPYHIELAISYHDPQFHRGTIYKASQAQPMYVDGTGKPVPGSSGKYGWCWKLSRPEWQWADLTGIQSRTLRMF